MRVIVNTTPAVMPGPQTRSRPVIQNLGPGTVYIDTDENVSTATGFQLSPGTVYEFPVSGAYSKLYAVADEDNTEVRLVRIG